MTRAGWEPRPNPHSPTTHAENLRRVLPLLFLALASFVISYFLFHYSTSIHPTRVPLWLLSIAIGVIAATGATTGFVFGDFSEPEPIAVRAADFDQFVLVPRPEWEKIQAARVLGAYAQSPVADAEPPTAWTEPPASLPEPVLPLESPARSPAAFSAAVSTVEGVTPAGGSSEPRPIWAEGIPPPSGRARTRSADQLATQVDELLRDLDLAAVIDPKTPTPAPIAPEVPVPAPASPAAPAPGRHSTRRKSIATSPVSGVPLGAAISVADASDATTQSVRDEYESLLAQLRNEAEQAAPSPLSRDEVLCSSCRRRLDANERWESCPTCWRIFCPACLARVRVMGEPWFCPTCRARPD